MTANPFFAAQHGHLINLRKKLTDRAEVSGEDPKTPEHGRGRREPKRKIISSDSDK